MARETTADRRRILGSYLGRVYIEVQGRPLYATSARVGVSAERS